ncbi:MAG TPA: hypothetical protein VN894_15525 [Polyangiaceae bacterium]|nr:hypothetical protein [Polyangiaceae bacterium]
MNPARAVAAAVPLLFLPLSCGCVGAPPAPQAPAAPVDVAPPPLPKPPDVSAVPDPPALVVSGRLAKPSASLVMVREWTKLPQPQSAEVTELVTGEAIGPLVDLDQPIDFAVAVAGTGPRIHDRTAVSAVLKDVERAKATLQDRYKLVPGDNGALLVQGLGRRAHHDTDEGGDDRADDERRACEIAPAYGAAPTRLVCAWGGKALSELAPWLTRSAPRATTTSDLHVDLRMQPLRATLSGAKRLIGSLLASTVGSRLGLSSARELVSSIGGDVVDFALDLDTASLDVQLSDPASIATATLRFSGRTSALARLATAHPDRSAVPPAAFWQLPGDADFAFFERGIDDAELARARDLALRVAGDRLAEDGLKEADRKPILEALGNLATSAPLAYASGLDEDAAIKAIAAERSRKEGSDAAALEEARLTSAEVLLGWRVMELDEPAARLAGAVNDLGSAWGRPAVVAAFHTKGRRAPALHPSPMPKGVTLPAGTLHYVFEYPFGEPRAGSAGNQKVAALPSKTLAIQLFIAPAGAHAWVGLGGGAVLVASKLGAATGTAPDNLAARAEIAPLKTATVGAAGFLTVRGFAGAAQLLAATFGDRTADLEGFDDLAQMPHKGEVPVWFSWTARPDEGGVAPFTTTLEIPRAAMEDIATAILRHGF